MEEKIEWERIVLYKPEMVDVSNIIHYASQYLAMAGVAFVPGKSDDSHTNAGWDSSRSWLVGGDIASSENGTIHVALDAVGLSLMVVSNNLDVLDSFALKGHTFDQGFDWLASDLQKRGLEGSKLSKKLHYTIPDHSIAHGSNFEITNPELFAEMAKIRTNGHLAMQKALVDYPTADALRVWPHHFDEGSYIPLVTADASKEVTGSISIGLAMPDVYYDNPYFYITAWTKDGIKVDKPFGIHFPGKWHEHEWVGQILETKDLGAFKRVEQQEEATGDFLKEGMQQAMALIDIVVRR